MMALAAGNPAPVNNNLTYVAINDDDKKNKKDNKKCPQVKLKKKVASRIRTGDYRGPAQEMNH